MIKWTSNCEYIWIYFLQLSSKPVSHTDAGEPQQQLLNCHSVSPLRNTKLIHSDTVSENISMSPFSRQTAADKTWGRTWIHTWTQTAASYPVKTLLLLLLLLLNIRLYRRRNCSWNDCLMSIQARLCHKILTCLIKSFYTGVKPSTSTNQKVSSSGFSSFMHDLWFTSDLKYI